MKVYLVNRKYLEQDTEVLGVFSSRCLATDHMNRVRLSNHHDSEYYVNYNIAVFNMDGKINISIDELQKYENEIRLMNINFIKNMLNYD